MSNHTFTGVFIPAKIWLAKDLIPQEKMMLAEIKALSEDSGWCFASNKHFAEWLGCGTQNISNYIKRFEREGMIQVTYTDKKTFAGRKIRVNTEWFHGLATPYTGNVTPYTGNVTPYTGNVTEIQFKSTSKPLESAHTPTPAESSNLKEEKTENGLVAPPPAESPANLKTEIPQPPKVAPKGSAPAESAEPTHLLKLTGPENPGVMEAEGIALSVATALTYDQYPNPKNSQQLKEAMRNYFVANPREWQDGVLEQSRATNWTPEKIADCITAFCAHQEAEGNLKRTYGQYKGMLVKWFLGERKYDRAKPGPTAQPTQSAPPANFKSSNRY